MLEKYSERIPSGISMSAQFLERSNALIGVFVSCLRVPPENRVCLCRRMVSKRLNKLSETHFRPRQVPLLMFSMALNPN
jgi:hypothetical protein